MRLLPVVAALLCVARVALADGINVSVDRTEISMQDTIQLTVTVEGSRSAQPTLPPLPQFEVHSRGQSTQVHIINGSMSTSGTYTFELVPKQVGAFTVDRASVTIDGKVYHSDAFSIKVSQSAAEPSESGDAFVTSEVSTKEPYVGQQVVYTWRFYRRVRISNASIGLPSFDGFWVQDLGAQRDYQTNVRGQQYLVTEIRKALFPQEHGTQTLPSVGLDVDIVRGRALDDGFGGSPFDEMLGRVQRQHKTLRTPPVELKVQSLPPAPPNFSHLVGQFKIDAQVSQRQLNVGDSTTLTVTIAGIGNVQNIVDPQLPTLQGFKVYDDKPIMTLNNKGDVLTGTKVFKKALVPTQGGTLTIPAISIITFDPTNKGYVTQSTQPFVLQVVQGANAVSNQRPGLAPAFPPVSNKVNVQILGDDLLPIYKRDDALRGPTKRLRDHIAWGILFFVPPLAALGTVLAQRRRETLRDPSARRRREALSRGLKALGEVRDLVAKGQVAPAAMRASRGVREYLGDKLGLEGLALTPHEARERLEGRGVQQDLALKVEGVLQRCEAAQYGADVRGKDTWTALPGELKALLNQLDRALRA